MVGVYKITSPSGKVYFGQSWKIEKRHADYRYLKCKDIPLLYKSFMKYGVNAHIFEAVIELPEDTLQEHLDAVEIFCIAQYREAGMPLLNVKEGGSRGKHAPASLEKLRAKRKMQAPPTLGRKFDDAWRNNISAGQKGRKYSEEQRKAMMPVWESHKGFKFNDEAREKMRAGHARNNIWLGKKHSVESRRLQSLAKMGHKINCKKVLRISSGEIFNSLTEAAASIGIQMKTLSARMTAKSKTPKDFVYV